MHRQFVRVYVILILTVIGLLVGAGVLFETIMAGHNSYQLSLPRVFEQYVKAPDAAGVRAINPTSVQFPSQSNERLQNGEVVPVALSDNQITFYKQEQGMLLAFGPVKDDSSQWEQADRTFTLVFYIILAVVLLILLFPIGRDILRVQRSAIRFSHTPQKLTTDVKPGSSVYPLASTLENMSARIVDLLQLQRDLSNTVAHEVRTPLSRMEFVLQQIGPDIAARYRQRLQKDIEEINLLVTDYLEFARNQHQRPALNIKRQSGQTLMGVLRDNFAFYQSEVAIDFEWDDTPCDFDYNLMQVAAQNLIMNALRYARQHIHVSWRVTASSCELCVADDGVGLKGKQAALKKAFHQGDTDSKNMGFGLGLYITNNIARQHQGHLQTGDDDALGGARFTLVWPRDIVPGQSG